MTSDNSQDLLQELEESIPQGRANDTQLATGDGLDELDALDALLADSLEQAEAAAQYKRDREAAKRGFVGLSKEEVEYCNSRMRAFELAREWDADRCIAVFVGYVCAKCDSCRVVFSRLMEHHQHRRVATTHRWVTVAESKLAPETVYDQVEVPLCADCAEEFGMGNPLDQDIPWLSDVLSGKELEEVQNAITGEVDEPETNEVPLEELVDLSAEDEGEDNAQDN